MLVLVHAGAGIPPPPLAGVGGWRAPVANRRGGGRRSSRAHTISHTISTPQLLGCPSCTPYCPTPYLPCCADGRGPVPAGRRSSRLQPRPAYNARCPARTEHPARLRAQHRLTGDACRRHASRACGWAGEGVRRGGLRFSFSKLGNSSLGCFGQPQTPGGPGPTSALQDAPAGRPLPRPARGWRYPRPRACLAKRLEALLGGAAVIEMAHAGALRTRLAEIP
jgi:hypothetical protein